jgi:hypothetical protein
MDNSNASFLTTEEIDMVDVIKKDFDIREHMDYAKIKTILVNFPLEMSTLELICMMINNNYNKKNNIDKS